MTDIEMIQVSFTVENSGEEPADIATEVQDEIGRGETQNNLMKGLQSSWQAILIGILMVLLCGVTGVLLSQMNKQQLKQLLNSTHQNFTLRGCHCGQLKLLINVTRYNFTLLYAEKTQLSLLLNNTLQKNTQLSLLLKNTLQEKTQLSLLLKNTSQEKTQLSLLLNNTLQEKTQLSLLLKNMSQEKTQVSLLLNNTLQEKIVENKELNMFLNLTLKNCNPVKENRQLNLHLKASLHNITMASADSKLLHLLLNNETSMQLEAENQHQRSILFPDNLSFLWRFCNKSTLQCSRCLPSWTEHTSRCFILSQETNNWEDARRECFHMGGDLAVVLNAEDQEFLINMTFQFVQQHPQVDFHSAWIGLQDMVKEGTFLWVNGNKIQKDVIYWKHLEPNNAMASWYNDWAGQDCVAILPPRRIGEKDWLNSWDDIVCVGRRRYICETTALSLS